MRCRNCGRAATSSIKHLGALCEACFSRVFEKRVRKYVRINRAFRKDDRILVSDELSNYLVKSIVKGMPVKIFFKRNTGDIKGFVKKSRINKRVAVWTLDDEINQFLEGIALNKKAKKISEKNGEIKLLKHVTDEESRLFAEYKKLRFLENKKNESIQRFTDSLSNSYPEVKFGLSKSIEAMERIKK